MYILNLREKEILRVEIRCIYIVYLLLFIYLFPLLLLLLLLGEPRE